MGSLKYVNCVGLSQGHRPIKRFGHLKKKPWNMPATFELPLFLHPLDHSLMTAGGHARRSTFDTPRITPQFLLQQKTAAMAQILTLVEQNTFTCAFFVVFQVQIASKMLKQAKAKMAYLFTADVCCTPIIF